MKPEIGEKGRRGNGINHHEACLPEAWFTRRGEGMKGEEDGVV